MAKYLIYFLENSPVLTKSQVDRVASIFSDIAQIIAGSLVIPLLLGRQDGRFIISSLTAATLFWILSVRLSQ